MKLKHILSMIAGLVTLTATSCNDKSTATNEAEVTSPSATEAPAEVAESTEVAEEAHAAYYVEFLGNGG